MPWLEGLPSSIGATLARKNITFKQRELDFFLIDLLNFIFYMVNVY